MMSRQAISYATIKCGKTECAWWDDSYDNGRCSIVTIAKNLDYVADLCDGTRTLFVRNV